MPDSAWFAAIQLDSASPATRRTFDRLVELLDRLQPAKLNAAGSYVQANGDEIVILLAHTADDSADLEIVIRSTWAGIYGLHSEEAYQPGHEPEGSWENDLLDELTATLQGRYVIEDAVWQGRLLRTRVTDLADKSRSTERIHGILAMIPIPRRWLTISSRELNYGCHTAFETPPTT